MEGNLWHNFTGEYGDVLLSEYRLRRFSAVLSGVELPCGAIVHVRSRMPSNLLTRGSLFRCAQSGSQKCETVT